MQAAREEESISREGKDYEPSSQATLERTTASEAGKREVKPEEKKVESHVKETPKQIPEHEEATTQRKEEAGDVPSKAELAREERKAEEPSLSAKEAEKPKPSAHAEQRSRPESQAARHEAESSVDVKAKELRERAGHFAEVVQKSGQEIGGELKAAGTKIATDVEKAMEKLSVASKQIGHRLDVKKEEKQAEDEKAPSASVSADIAGSGSVAGGLTTGHAPRGKEEEVLPVSKGPSAGKSEKGERRKEASKEGAMGHEKEALMAATEDIHGAVQTVQEVSKKSLQGAAEVLVAAGDMATDAAKVSATWHRKALQYLRKEP